MRSQCHHLAALPVFNYGSFRACTCSTTLCQCNNPCGMGWGKPHPDEHLKILVFSSYRLHMMWWWSLDCLSFPCGLEDVPGSSLRLLKHLSFLKLLSTHRPQLGGLNNQNFGLTVLEGRGLKSQSARLVSGEGWLASVCVMAWPFLGAACRSG